MSTIMMSQLRLFSIATVSRVAGVAMLMAGLLATPAQVHAQQQGDLLYPTPPIGLYFGPSFGVSTFDAGVDDAGTVDLSEDRGYSLDEEDSAYSITLGYAFGDALSAEIFYSDLGQLSSSGNIPFTEFPPGRNFTCTAQSGQSGNNNTCDLRIGIKSVGIALKGSFRIADDLSMFLKGGYHLYETSYTVSNPAANNPSDRSRSQTVDDSGALFGLGLEYEMNPSSSLLFGYDAYLSEVRYLYLGLQFNLQPRY